MKKFCRIVFSRYAISALLILFELTAFSFITLYAYSYSAAFYVIAIIVDVLVIISLINRNTNPEFKLTWLAVVTLVPVVGGLMYITFSSRKMSRNESKLVSRIFLEVKDNMKKTGEQTVNLENLGSLARVSELAAGRAFSLIKDDGSAVVYRNTESTYFSSGEEFYASMLSALASAEKYIFLEFFIIEDGVMWRGIENILKEKTRNGVTVRVLYDDIGSMSTLPRDFCRKLRNMGIECHAFAKVNPRVTAAHNNRDHRKICVVDGKIAFTGGVNIADEYINEKRRFGHWKDGGIRVDGDAARGFARLFLSLYDFAVGSVSDYSQYLGAHEHGKSECIPILTADSDSSSGNTDEITGALEKIASDYKQKPKTDGKASESKEKKSGYLIPFGSGPAPAYLEPVGKNTLMNLIGIARRYLYITTPYLIIDYDLTEALRSAAKRGVDVRIITPAIADKKMVKIMTKSSYPRLIEAGVRIFEYTPGFIHEKLLVSDDRYAVVGTINLDYRSLVHHFEDGLWLFDDPEIPKMRDCFLSTESKSCEIPMESAGLGVRELVVRSLVRIFSPLL